MGHLDDIVSRNTRPSQLDEVESPAEAIRRIEAGEATRLPDGRRRRLVLWATGVVVGVLVGVVIAVVRLLVR
jgi:hypothetical protein